MEVMTRIKVTPCTVVNRYPTISVPPTLIENSVWVTSSPSSLSAVIWTTLRPSFASAPKHAFGRKKKTIWENRYKTRIVAYLSQFIYGLYILLVQFIELVHFVRVGELHALPHHVVTHEGGRHKIPIVNDDVHHYLRYNIPQKLSTDWEPNPEVASTSISKIFQQHNRYLHSCWLNRPRGHKSDACAKQVCVDQARRYR